MRLSGIQRFTMLDFPGRIACIAFTPGCNFRCGYCHNPEFVLPEEVCKLADSFVPEEAFLNFLERRKGLLSGVVVSGGEPTVHADLPAFFRKIRALGFATKLDTNGSNPVMLRAILEEGLVDYVAMDLKTTLERYQELSGARANPEMVGESLALLKESGIDYELRSTILREHHDEPTLAGMAELAEGAPHYFLQQFRPGKTLDPAFASCTAFSRGEMEVFCEQIFAPRVGEADVRE